jgi:hypothetical protein
VAAMFAEEKPFLQPLPLEPFRYYQYGERTVHLDGCVEVEAAYYGAPPGWIGRQVHVQWDAMFVRLLDPRSAELLREYLSGKRGRASHPRCGSSAPHAAAIASTAGTCPQGRTQHRRCLRRHPCSPGRPRDASHPGRSPLGQAIWQRGFGQRLRGSAGLRVPEDRFVRRYLERSPQAPLSLRQVDHLIRELTQHRHLIQQRIQFETRKS